MNDKICILSRVSTEQRWLSQRPPAAKTRPRLPSASGLSSTLNLSRYILHESSAQFDLTVEIFFFLVRFLGRERVLFLFFLIVFFVFLLFFYKFPPQLKECWRNALTRLETYHCHKLLRLHILVSSSSPSSPFRRFFVSWREGGRGEGLVG